MELKDCTCIFINEQSTNKRQSEKLPVTRALKLKLKTIHKCFLCPYIRQFSMLCYIAFRFLEHLWSQDAGKVSHREGSIAQTTNLLRIHVLVFSLHIIGHLFSNCSKSSNTRLQSLNITFYPCCKCATFLCARTPRNAMRHSIEICLI